ncbi:hypothetical protein PCASD_07626 [Puccinia coronata f. sp. avenae]|uniref:Uncharacterized protein n=1 Tax=Puccinia coronata f. sp. avenae TaxID=200324 RepID=A0A2N5UNG9_9BASI|nr:hypothetical protein PCASD_12877 [Puccinia coronata f. sp. avenae]PLW39157.1 hypothetical protein PCASD_07626 [Puccinia coronata f. sp. avenae]
MIQNNGPQPRKAAAARDKPQIPQLQRRNLDNKTPQTTKAAVNKDHCTLTINHLPIYAVRVHQPHQKTRSFLLVSAPQLPEEGTTPGNREISMAHSQQHPFPSLISSPKTNGSDRSDPQHSLIVPGVTPKANSLRLAELFWQEDKLIIKRQKLTKWLGSAEDCI